MNERNPSYRATIEILEIFSQSREIRRPLIRARTTCKIVNPHDSGGLVRRENTIQEGIIPRVSIYVDGNRDVPLARPFIRGPSPELLRAPKSFRPYRASTKREMRPHARVFRGYVAAIISAGGDKFYALRFRCRRRLQMRQSTSLLAALFYTFCI